MCGVGGGEHWAAVQTQEARSIFLSRLASPLLTCPGQQLMESVTVDREVFSPLSLAEGLGSLPWKPTDYCPTRTSHLVPYYMQST